VLVGAAVAGPALLIVSDFLTLFEVKAVTVKIPEGTVTGHANHSFAMTLIGLAAIPMAYGVVRARSRPAMVALLALGALATVIALAFDLPDAHGVSTLAKTFADAQAHPRAGFFMETLGAALLLIAGGGSLLLTVPEGSSRRGAAGRPARPAAEPAAETHSPALGSPSPAPAPAGSAQPPPAVKARPAGMSRSEQERAAAAAARAQARAAQSGGGGETPGGPAERPRRRRRRFL
jgi:hypothetical protein